jgi:hypothetical protein
MKKFAAQIERDMAFLMSKDLKKSLNTSDAISHLIKAKHLLDNVGLKSHSERLNSIIKNASSIDDTDIEVTV